MRPVRERYKMKLQFQLFSALTFISLSLSTAHATDDLKVQVVEHSYSFSTNNSLQMPAAQNIKLQIQFVTPQNEKQLAQAREWLGKTERAYSIANNQKYAITFGSQTVAQDLAPALQDAHLRENLHVPESALKRISSWLGEKKSNLKKKFDDFVYRFSSNKIEVAGQTLKYQPTLGVVRGVANGTVISLSFMASGMPPAASVAVGAALGATSGMIQWKIVPFSKFLESEGWVHSFYKKAASQFIFLNTLAGAYTTGFDFSLSRQIALDAQKRFLELPFAKSALYNTNLITKWFLVEVLILAAADIGFRLAGSPLEATAAGSIAAVLTTSALATVGQGTWDFGFIIDKAKKDEELKQRREALIAADQLTEEASEEIERAQSKVNFSLAAKAFTISVTSNIAAAMLLTGSEATEILASNLMTGLSVAGASYYGYVQYKYNKGLRQKIFSNLLGAYYYGKALLDNPFEFQIRKVKSSVDATVETIKKSCSDYLTRVPLTDPVPGLNI